MDILRLKSGQFSIISLKHYLTKYECDTCAQEVKVLKVMCVMNLINEGITFVYICLNIVSTS